MTNNKPTEDLKGFGPGWDGTVSQGMKQIASPNNSVLVLGRVLVYSDSDISTAYDPAKQIQLTPFL